MNKKYNEIYTQIKTTISNLIPDEWNQIWLYAEVLNDATNVYYYFKSKTTNKLICCMDVVLCQEKVQIKFG